MKSHRIISHSCAVAAAALVVLPACAQAGSALSGYGGPGQGSQAVLGSALVGGARGGGSNGGGSGGGGPTGASVSRAAGETSSASSPAAQQPSGAGSDSTPQKGGSSARSAGGDTASHAGSTQRTTRATAQPGASPHGLYPVAERVPAGAQGTVLGLTGDDLLYVILAAVMLVLVGGFTRRVGDPAGRARIGG